MIGHVDNSMREFLVSEDTAPKPVMEKERDIFLLYRGEREKGGEGGGKNVSSFIE